MSTLKVSRDTVHGTLEHFAETRWVGSQGQSGRPTTHHQRVKITFFTQMDTIIWNEKKKQHYNWDNSSHRLFEPIVYIQSCLKWKCKDSESVSTLEPDVSVGFPAGGRAAMVKLSGSSLSLILDSFIRLSSFFFAMFSTCFLLADV